MIEEEEDLPWIQEKALDLVEFTGSVTQAIPGPRVGTSSLPWMLAVPLAYLGITFVFAFYKTVKKFNSPRELRRKQVAFLYICCELDWWQTYSFCLCLVIVEFLDLNFAVKC